MRPPIIAVALLVGLSLVAPIQADHGCNGTVTQIDAGSETFYLDDRSTELGERNHWLYRETNGISGLQSGGSVDLLPETIGPAFPDPCPHRTETDKLIIMFNV